MLAISEDDLFHLGCGVVAYVKQIRRAEVAQLLGNTSAFPPSAETFFCLYAANGVPLSISGSCMAAIGDARAHDLIPATLH